MCVLERRLPKLSNSTPSMRCFSSERIAPRRRNYVEGHGFSFINEKEFFRRSRARFNRKNRIAYSMLILGIFEVKVIYRKRKNMPIERFREAGFLKACAVLDG